MTVKLASFRERVMTIARLAEAAKRQPQAVLPAKKLPCGLAQSSEIIAEPTDYFGSSDAKSGCGRAITSAMMSFPPSRSTVALPVSMAV